MAGDRLPRTRARFSLRLLLATTALGAVSAHAQDATWTGATGEWTTSTNWTPATVPTGTATFSNNGTNSIKNAGGFVTIGETLFTSAPNAQAYTFTTVNNFSYTFNGTGIINNSIQQQIFAANQGALLFQNASTASGGTGAVLLQIGLNGTNALASFANTSTAGTASIQNGGILQFSDSSRAGTANILNISGNINFLDSSSATSANITNQAANIIFKNTATAGSSTIINNGVNENGLVQFNDSSTAGSSHITNTALNAIVFNNTSTAGSAIIGNNTQGKIDFNDSSSAGNAQITNTDAGSVVSFHGTSTAGNSIISNTLGVIQFFDSSSAGSASITNTPGADFYKVVFNNSSTAGSSTIVINGGNALALSFNDSATAGNSTITINSGFATFNGQATAGSADITNKDGLEFFDTTNAGSATIHNSGFASFGNSADAGTAQIINASGGSVNFIQTSTADGATIINSGDIFFAGSASGASARVINNAGGKVDFSSLTTDGTTAGSIEGAGNYLLGSKSLTVGSNNLSTAVSGVIADGGTGGGIGGSLTKVGTGTLMLTGTNTYTGATTVNGGTLQVDGSIASSSLTTVAANAALTGTGSVGATQINANGLFAPGDGTPGSSMTVAGNLAFASGALFLVQINPTTSSFANVTGTASLGGTVNAVFANGTYVAKKYTIVTAGSISGTFDPTTVNTNLPSGFKTDLSYDATHAFLDLSLAFIPPSGALNGNQQNVGNALINFFNGTGSIPLVFGALTPAGLTQLSGESATGSQQTTFDAMGQFMGLLTDPFIAGRGDPVSGGGSPTAYAEETLAYAAKKKQTDAFAMFTKAPPVTPFAQRWSVWAAGFGGSQHTDGNTALGSNDTSGSIFGTAVGADYRISPNTLAGFALAGGGTNFSVNTLGSGRSDLFQAGAFVRHNVGPAYITGALAYGWQDVTTDRIVTVAGLDHLRAEFNANAWSGRVEGGYRLVVPVARGIGITPYAAGQFVTFDLPNYMEQAIVGSNQFALAYNAKSATDARSEFGVRTDKSFAMANGILTLRGRLAWAHDYDPDRSALATFQTLPGASFVVNGARHAADSALTTASAEWKWINGWSAAATFEGEFSDITNSCAGKGVVRYAW